MCQVNAVSCTSFLKVIDNLCTGRYILGQYFIAHFVLCEGFQPPYPVEEIAKLYVYNVFVFHFM